LRASYCNGREEGGAGTSRQADAGVASSESAKSRVLVLVPRSTSETAGSSTPAVALHLTDDAWPA
jgi:hypothetical protein